MFNQLNLKAFSPTLTPAVLLGTFAIASAQSEQSAHPKGSSEAHAWRVSDGGNGHVYEAVLTEEPVTWEEAKSEARRKGGHLATITSQGELDFIVDLTRNDAYWLEMSEEPYRYNGPWLGAYQEEGADEPGDGWRWVTGEEFTWITPDDEEPNNTNPYGRSEDVLQLFFIDEEALNEESIQTFQPKFNDTPLDGLKEVGGVMSYVVEWDGFATGDVLTESDEKEAVKQHIENHYKELAEGDFESFFKHAHPEAVYFVGDQGKIQTRISGEARQKRIEGANESYQNGKRVRITPKDITVMVDESGDSAFACYLREGTIKEPGEDGEIEQVRGRSTVVFTKADGRWRGIHWHISPLEGPEDGDEQ